MRVALGVCAVALGFAAGCCTNAPVPQTRQPVPTVVPITVELPLAKPTRTEPDLRTLAKTPIKQVSATEGTEYRRVTEPICQRLAAQNASLANALDAEGSVPVGRETAADKLKQTTRYFAALELRNRAAADALERFFQLAGAESQTDFPRAAFPVVDDLLKKAKAARAANVRFPLDPADLERQRLQTFTQLEQAETESDLLNIDLKRRLGLSASFERLWPSGDFGIDTDPVNAEQAVNAALADRPELRGLRAVHADLTPDTLPLAREQLRAASPLLGGSPPAPRGLPRFLFHNRAEAKARAELEVRKKQLAERINEREREVADEARAAAVSLNAQTRRVQLARDRLDAWTATRADATRKREANQPGAELLEAQATLDWLKARAEVVAEVMTWHQTRVQLKAAQGWLSWECLDDRPGILK